MANPKPIASSATEQLLARLDTVGKRLLSLGVLTALGWALLAGIGVMIVAFWLDLIWELSPTARRFTPWFAVLSGIAVFAIRMVKLLRQAQHDNIASKLDMVANTGGQITSGLQLAKLATGANNATPIQQGLAELAVVDAANITGDIKQNDAVSSKPLIRVATVIGGLMLIALAVTLAVPKLLSTEISRFAAPNSDVPTFSMLEFDVTPGNTSVHYGQSVDIEVQLNSASIDEPQLLLFGEATETVPMFHQGDLRWRTTLFKVKESTGYQVQAGRAKSDRFQIDLIAVPTIKDLQFRLTPPQYTRLGDRIVGWQDSITGLRGTKVEVIASSNMPLKSGTLKLTRSGSQKDSETREVALSPLGTDETTAVGSFEIQDNEKFDLVLTNTDEIESVQPVSGTIELLKDQRPFIRLVSPKPSSLATNSIQLPISISAEDDFGIAQITLYRSLNQSKSRPQEIKFEKQSTRLSGTVMLPLHRYDLVPGDTLELFARVEDNRPGEAIGSESPVHTVKIISQQQYMKMNRQQLGVEAVLSKYRMIQRRLENLEQDQRAIEAMDDEDEPKTKEARLEEIKRVKENFKQAGLELEGMMQQQFPIDLEQDLSDRIAEMSDKMFEIAEEIEALEEEFSQGKIDNKELKERLQALREKLQGIREDFQDEVMQPMDQLAEVFELMSMQRLFVQIVAQQKGLASRLKSLDGNDNADQPDVKRRMRERADEQTALKRALNELVERIGNNAVVLPVGGDLQELRESAMKFTATIVNSDAEEEQDLAARDLAEFSGSGGYAHAQKAAVILESMLDDSQEMEQAGQQAGARIFKPGFGRPKLGNSLDQLMDMFGPQNGSQMGGRNRRGLYGDQPQQRQAKRGGGKGDRNNPGSDGVFSIGPPEDHQDGNVVKRSGGKVGSSQIKIPPRYQRQVGQYYRRIVDETGE